MHLLSFSILLALVAELALAAPAPTFAAKVENRANTCTFSGSSGASLASISKTSCATIVLSNVAVPSGKTLDLTDLSSGTTVIFEGTTTFGYKEWAGPLVSISGTDITVTGASGSVLDGGGAQYWDGKGSNGGKKKPKFFYAHSLTNSIIQDLTIINSPVQVYSIDNANGLFMNNLIIDDSAGDAGSLGHNTDAFDIGDSSGVYITGANVKNQDDCLAINSGTNITFTNGTCSGGHGLSIGSVGGRSNNAVQAITISNSIITNSQNGIRIKTVSGATGSVSGVTYSDITLGNITKYGIVIEQDYENGSPTGTPTTGVPIIDLTLSSITGSIASSATGVYVLCGSSNSCSNWNWSGVSVTGGKNSAGCENVPNGASC
jgi:polygalacturonase